MTRIIAIVAACFVVLLLGGTYAVSSGWVSDVLGLGPDDPYAPCRRAAVAGGAGAIGGPFELVNPEGETVTDEDVITEPSLVYFGYTFCPDVCPMDVARNAQAVDVLSEQGHEVQPVFISVDPERDTPEVVGDFAANIHEDMVALTGSEEQVNAASQAYRAYHSKQPGDDEYYLVDHSTFTYLVTPEDGFVEYFRRDLSPEELAERTSCFLEAS
ncbi:SCO family protein [Allosediminivita pacifica]|uniref:Protein SCO1/2 n=1 Tax=Allosediminivita pacifica TaxID=1267769 RepID=A0A2T6AR65_9RHOB|nr:SCO family protein [Allosediminivita pacifica]PTX46303.1 protein SCO1/2 [Allosediminivita pacifica]GGB18027.1 protein senC [Allosediminivita pacifica]